MPPWVQSSAGSGRCLWSRSAEASRGDSSGLDHHGDPLRRLTGLHYYRGPAGRLPFTIRPEIQPSYYISNMILYTLHIVTTYPSKQIFQSSCETTDNTMQTSGLQAATSLARALVTSQNMGKGSGLLFLSLYFHLFFPPSPWLLVNKEDIVRVWPWDLSSLLVCLLRDREAASDTLARPVDGPRLVLWCYLNP